MASYQDLLDSLQQGKSQQDTIPPTSVSQGPAVNTPDPNKLAALAQIANPPSVQAPYAPTQAPNPSALRSFLQSTIGDKANAAGDDSVQPSMSPLDVLPYGEMANGALAVGKGAANAIGEAAPRILGNEIGSIGSNIAAKSAVDPLAKYGGAEALEGLSGNQLPAEMTGRERLALQQARSGVKVVPTAEQAANDAQFPAGAPKNFFDKAKATATDKGIGAPPDMFAGQAQDTADRMAARKAKQLLDAKNRFKTIVGDGT